jgi:hypothetical protein
MPFPVKGFDPENDLETLTGKKKTVNLNLCRSNTPEPISIQFLNSDKFGR